MRHPRLAGAAKKIEAIYEAPYLAHAPMEPLNCIADVRADSCEVWASTQRQSTAHQERHPHHWLAPGSSEDPHRVHGWRIRPPRASDYIADSVEISKALGAPVQVTWTREDDTQQDAYRPASYTRFFAGLDAEGSPVAFHSRIVCPPFGGVRMESRARALKVSSIRPTRSQLPGGLSCGRSREFRLATGAP